MHLHKKEGDEAAAAYRAELEALMNEYPDEIEARLFLWRELDGGLDPDGRPRDDQIYGQLLLESQFEAFPNHHGLLHYWIHQQESGKYPETALDAAQRLAALAPNAGHIVHMPGHIHFRMGNYDAAHEQFILADEADARYIREYGVDPIFTWNYLHNISFLNANLAEAGRFAEASEHASAFASTAEASEYKNYVGYSMVSGRATLEPFKVVLRSGDFARAAAVLRESPEYRGENVEEFAMRRSAYQAYADGMAALQQDDIESAEAMSDRLDGLLWRAERDDFKLYGRSILNIYSLELRAMLEHAKGDSDAAIELLERAAEQEAKLRYHEPPPYVRPIAESLAEVYLAKEEWQQARDAYSAMMEVRKKSGYGLFGIARSYELEGKQAEARTAYRDFLDAWANADDDRPRVQHARDWLAANTT
jgi:tetratricopeptide (TPR) repeat protein